MPAHRHGAMAPTQPNGGDKPAYASTGGGGDPAQYAIGGSTSEATLYQTGPAGSGSTHDHDAGTLKIDMDVAYASAIIGVKD